MENLKPPEHPDHFSMDKNLLQKLLDWIVPIGILLIYFFFYNFGKITPSEMIKTTGLVAIALLSITLFIGSLSRFIPAVNILKVHRKHWGIASFVLAIIHTFLVIMFFYKFDFFRLFNFTKSNTIGIQAGLIALLILFMVTVSSFHMIFEKLPEGMWKKLQMTSYIALALVVLHFFLMEQKDGVFVIKRLLGQITYWFAFVVLIARIVVAIFPKKEHIQPPPITA
ncbi:hypothetical protein A3D80_03400 [Candidatus Roizmanbacteria bacterium RIFCSPHIGHO2_02_FULL_40_13b]|uniref:Ferric oxidoreductase domain-containing protein n=1 Tax=Candidatus Roizmanbacteria bacterium RIFCSPHIGHO2_01_FULL_39_24 TaxID=1802032 RepID=A0A1F7GM17_9BACT|nr:MAG: hypothetical protein A2799_01145 [Candidatus Roizmanbacteria bacterium RIFCSPHIGHO2_01_FULL_39_24]OGK27012.1 MAG: hypothetical protein A3D80_03400 [Candidatus Roizmanbacteria bacterium RIFCSPHIGHO2_02_FULL_40_13b]OGK48833.1 MAG: hypothetical protein A3A56_01325 [Candidatus Roizmanbacteria bacterium RIFCSPLOWO2_01_FULL_40_32]OGK57284.1 MAG: hypothetical protein A3H83_00070 [Candidatus Roizmanbacteria bacterium RIFCSPLOWO2_02_FULL_39_8]